MGSKGQSLCRDDPRWALRFLSWLGLLIGLIGAMQFAGSTISMARFYWVVFTSGRLIDIVYYFCQELLWASSLLLILGAAGLIMGRKWARGLLIAWAILVLVMGFLHGSLIIVRGTNAQAFARRGIDWIWVMRIFLDWGASLGFPLTVLCVMALPQTRTALTILPGAAFGVLRPGDSRSEDVPVSWRTSEANIASGASVLNLNEIFRHHLINAIASVGIFLGVLSTTMCLLRHRWPEHFWFGWLSYGVPDNWRGAVVRSLDWILRWFGVLLLVGSIETFARRKIGIKILWLWGICNLVAAVLMFLLYDLMHIAWEMGSSPGSILYRSDDISYTLSNAINAHAFAVIVAVLL